MFYPYINVRHLTGYDLNIHRCYFHHPTKYTTLEKYTFEIRKTPVNRLTGF